MNATTIHQLYNDFIDEVTPLTTYSCQYTLQGHYMPRPRNNQNIFLLINITVS